jgi:hypothetical protein
LVKISGQETAKLTLNKLAISKKATKEKRKMVIPKKPAKNTIYKHLLVKKLTNSQCIITRVRSKEALVRPKGKETNNSRRKDRGKTSHKILSWPL